MIIKTLTGLGALNNYIIELQLEYNLSEGMQHLTFINSNLQRDS